MNEPDVQFEEMNNPPFDFSGLANHSGEIAPKEECLTVPREDKIYNSLKEELLDKCHPQNFMKPFIRERFDCANTIYGKIRNIVDEQDPRLVELRNEAINQLGIYISTKEIYDYLLEYCDPIIYTDPYNGEYVEMAGGYYDRILKNANNIIELEKIKLEAQPLINIRVEQIKIAQAEREAEERKIAEAQKEEDTVEIYLVISALIIFFIVLIIILAVNNS